jgi:hypothetical protein
MLPRSVPSACIAYLAYNQYSEAVSLRQISGLRTGPAQKAGVLLSSVTLALVVVGLSRGKSLPELALQLGDDTGTEAENRTDTQTRSGAR